jgi:hypothetical protein
MDHLFSPCTRLHDLVESQGRLEEVRQSHPEPLQEVNLNEPTEELLSTERGFTYTDLHSMLGKGDTVAWLTPHAGIARKYGKAMRFLKKLDASYRFCFTVDGKDIVAFARSSEHLSEICDVVLRLLAVSVVHSVEIETWGCPDDALIGAPTLAYLMEQCQSLRVLTLQSLKMDENHCRVLGAYARRDLEISLECCKFTDAGKSALAEVLGRNRGPTKLHSCIIDNVVLANGLRGNSRLKSLKLRFSRNVEVADRQLHAITDALRENKGLVRLDLSYCLGRVNDVTLGAVCDSLKVHPTLEVLHLSGIFTITAPAPAVLKSRIQILVNMMKVNTTIHKINMDDRLSQHELYRRSLTPYLETNRLRPRLLAIQQARPIP